MVHKREKYLKRRKRKVTSLKLTTITSVFSPTSIKSSSLDKCTAFINVSSVTSEKVFLQLRVYNYKLTISKGESN